MDTTTPLPPTKGKFHVELESARGVAALLVAGFHCAQAPVLLGGQSVFLRAVPESGWFWKFLHLLHEQIVYSNEPLHHGVLFFFVLSGFLLTESLELGPAGIGRSGARFFLARLFRIYPAIVATVLIFWGVQQVFGNTLVQPPNSLSNLLRNLLLIEVNLDGVMWTLQVEFLAIPLLFAAFLLYRLWGAGAAALPALGFWSLAFVGPWVRWGSHGPSRTAWLYTFLIGALGYYLCRKICARWRRATSTAVFFLCVICFFTLGLLVHQQWQTAGKAIAAALLITVLAFGPRLSVSALLRTGPLRFLGRVSYSFYLLHPLTLLVIWRQPDLFGRWVQSGVPPIALSLALWLITTLAIAPLAWLMYRTVELPAVRLGKRLWRRSAA
ncbi:MAG: acyltransferase family protein [Chthoniobacterales bacterium]